MRISFLFIFIIAGCIVNGQEPLKQVIKKSKDKRIIESYSVTKKNKVKTGDYTKQVNYFIIERGRYENDVKVGVWEYFDKNDKLELKYDHTNDSLLYLEESRQIELKYNLLYLGSTFEKKIIIATNIKYPVQAQMKKLSGKVIVLVDYNADDDDFNYSVVKSVHPLLDSEALRVAKLIPTVWKPLMGALDFKKHQAYIPISFNLGFYAR